MNEFKTKLEIETLKALTYTQINEILNKLTLENKELKKQLKLCGVGVRSEQLKSFVEDYIQEFEENGTTGWERYDKAKKLFN